MTVVIRFQHGGHKSLIVSLQTVSEASITGLVSSHTIITSYFLFNRSLLMT